MFCILQNFWLESLLCQFLSWEKIWENWEIFFHKIPTLDVDTTMPASKSRWSSSSKATEKSSSSKGSSSSFSEIVGRGGALGTAPLETPLSSAEKRNQDFSYFRIYKYVHVSFLNIPTWRSRNPEPEIIIDKSRSTPFLDVKASFWCYINVVKQSICVLR